MAERFRFRLPWLTAQRAIDEEQQPPRPPAETQPPPVRPAAPIPIQRPPFRPAGIAQPPRNEPQPAVPSRAAAQPASGPQPPRAESQARTATESQAAVQTKSPPRGTIQTQTTSTPPSPSRGGSQSRSTSQPASPSRAAPQPRAASVPPSPSRSLRLATQRTGQTSPEHSSSPKKLQQTPQEPTLLVPEAPQLETEMATVIEPVSTSQNQTEPLQVLETPAAYQKPDFTITNADHSEKLPQPLNMETEEGKKDAELLKNAEQNGSGTEGKELPDATKKTVISSSREQEQVKSTNTRNTITQTHLKPVTTTGGKAHLHREIREDVSRFVQKMEAGYPMQPIGETPVSIVTLAGENKGATMHVGTESARKEEPVHILRGYKLNPYDSTEATSDGEGISKGRKSEDELTREEPTTRAYINSNLQSINNSIVFESSVNERNPGVQLTISQQPTAPASSSAKPGRLETRKAEFNIIPAEKHTYEPIVRRRCLRGLLMESSDSDPGNPEKPRRHGCRYSCGGKSKDRDIGVF